MSLKMFRKKNHSSAQPELFDEYTFFKAFSKDVKKAKHKVVIESPYITKRRAAEFAGLFLNHARKNLKITILTRNPDHHDGSMILQSIEGIKILRKSGIEVACFDDLRHRKIALIDDEILWQGSLNMLSHSNTREIMYRNFSAELVSKTKIFIGIK